jgi:hypothetical protein
LVAALAVAVPSGNAQAPGARTISLFEPANGGTFRIIDHAPRSPVKNPGSRKYRFSVGDELIFTNPLLDKRGGTRVGTLYGKATVVKGKTFRNVRTLSDVVFEFNDGSQIAAEGTFSFANTVRIAVTGGTRTYLGARGDVVSQSNNKDDSSQDTITLLP